MTFDQIVGIATIVGATAAVLALLPSGRIKIAGIIVVAALALALRPLFRQPPSGGSQPLPPPVTDTTKTDTGPSGGTVVVEEPKPKPHGSTKSSVTDYLASGLHEPEAGSWPWALILYGSPNADDLRGKAAESLRAQGRDTVNLFRNAAAEQKLAPDLFRGDASLGQQLRLGKYCARLLVGRLDTTTQDQPNGMVMAQATVTFRLLTPDGNVVSETSFSETDGDLNKAGAINRATQALRSSLPEKISSFLNE